MQRQVVWKNLIWPEADDDDDDDDDDDEEAESRFLSRESHHWQLMCAWVEVCVFAFSLLMSRTVEGKGVKERCFCPMETVSPSEVPPSSLSRVFGVLPHLVGGSVGSECCYAQIIKIPQRQTVFYDFWLQFYSLTQQRHQWADECCNDRYIFWKPVSITLQVCFDCVLHLVNTFHCWDVARNQCWTSGNITFTLCSAETEPVREKSSSELVSCSRISCSRISCHTTERPAETGLVLKQDCFVLHGFKTMIEQSQCCSDGQPIPFK